MMLLAPSQHRGVTRDTSIQLTLAGLGARKTSTLTARFIHLVQQGIDSRRVLAITFTKK